jgi:hypothetical protein
MKISICPKSCHWHFELAPARGFTLIAILMILFAAAPAAAQLRVEDRLRIGDISIAYDSNRWIPTAGDTSTNVRLICREPRCGIDIEMEVEEKLNVCRAETVNELLSQRLAQATKGQHPFRFPQRQEPRQFGKMTMHMTSATNGCHVLTSFVFACGEYRGKTYSMWLNPAE